MPRTSQTTDSTALQNYMTRNDLDVKQTAKNLGVSEGGVRGWLKKGKMPCLVARALTGLEKQNNKSGERHFVLCAADDERFELLITFCRGLGVAFEAMTFKPKE